MGYKLGLDFGTTNTALCAIYDDGSTRLASFSNVEDTQSQELAHHCRTALFFPEPEEQRRKPLSLAGDQALAACVTSAGEGRFIQSLKSFLASRAFGATQIFGVKFTLDDLLDRFMSFLVLTMEKEFEGLPDRIVVGAPVNYAYAQEDADNVFARTRMREAFARAQLHQVSFALEPVAAAHTARADLDDASLVLVADFGGGTSDFALVQMRTDNKVEVLGTAGVPVAGDSFDGKIVRHMVSQALGRGSLYKTFGGEPREIPATFFHKLERWHHLSLMNNPTTLRTIRVIERDALEPEKLAQLLVIIEENLGFHLHAAVGATKRALSSTTTARFAFDTGEEVLEGSVDRTEFETWIANDVDKIGAALDELLSQTEVAREDIGQVFMCGGTSFVPLIRETIAKRLAHAQQHGGSELVSIASGLARIAALDDDARTKVTLA